MPKLVREREAGEKSSIGRTNSFSKKEGWVLGERIGDKRMCGDVCTGAGQLSTTTLP